MSSDSHTPRLPSEALDAFLDGILAELRAPTDPAALDEVRAAFRRRVPFSLRSYAAAAMILRAAGLSRAAGHPEARPGTKPDARQGKDTPPRGKRPEAAAKKNGKSDGGASQGSRADSPSRPRLAGTASTIFVSMGKRQRLYPRVLIDLIVERAGLGLEEIGEVRSFDNYSFADIAPDKAGAVVSALDGYEFRGRKLTANPAKKRDGDASSN